MQRGWRLGGKRLIINYRRLRSRPRRSTQQGFDSAPGTVPNLAREHEATAGPTFPAAHAATTELALPSGRTRIPPGGAARGEAGVRSWTESPAKARKDRLPPPALGSPSKVGPPPPDWGTGPRRRPVGGGPRSSQQVHPLWCPAVEPWGVLTVNRQAMPGWSCCPRKSNKVAIESLPFPQSVSAAFAQGLLRVPA